MSIKHILSSPLKLIIYLYIFSLFIFTPYYNYKYIVNNGFIKWIFFGEIIATSKAMLWPYFIITSDHDAEVSKSQLLSNDEISSQFREDVSSMINTISSSLIYRYKF